MNFEIQDPRQTIPPPTSQPTTKKPSLPKIRVKASECVTQETNPTQETRLTSKGTPQTQASASPATGESTTNSTATNPTQPTQGSTKPHGSSGKISCSIKT